MEKKTNNKKIDKAQMACVYANELMKYKGKSRSEAFKIAWQIVKFIIAKKKEWYREEKGGGDVIVKYWSNYGRTRFYYTCSWLSSYANRNSYIVVK